MELSQLSNLNINIPMIIDVLGKAATILVVFAVTVGIMYLIMYYTSFNVPLTLYYVVGNTVMQKFDTGRITKEKMFKIMKDRSLYATMPASNDYHIKGKKQALTGIVVNNTVMWQPVKPNPGFAPVEWNAYKNLLAQEKTAWDTIQPKPSFWDRYGQQVLFIGGMAIILIMIIIVMQSVNKAIQMGKDIGVANAQANKQLLMAIPFMFRRRK